ncbi:PREDICTED: translocase of chloroplast 159, chloroplastic-like [Fragaria vesca subsp. vesca]
MASSKLPQLSSGSSSSSPSSASSASSSDSEIDINLAQKATDLKFDDDETNSGPGLGSDAGSETEEGFVSGEEDFGPVLDRAFVRGEQTLGSSEGVAEKNSNGGAVKLVSSSEFFLRPIAKVSVDSDDGEEEEEAGEEAFKEAVAAGESSVAEKGLSFAEVAKGNGVGGELEESKVVSEGLGSELESEVVNGTAEEVARESSENGLAGGGDSVVEAVRVELSHTGAAVVGDVEKIEESEIKGLEVPAGVRLDNEFEKISGEVEDAEDSELVAVEAESEGVVVAEPAVGKLVEEHGVDIASECDSVVDAVHVDLSHTGAAVVGDVEKLEESEIKGLEVPRGVSLENEFDQISGDSELPNDSKLVAVDSESEKDSKMVEEHAVDFTSEGDSVVQAVHVDLSHTGAAVVGDVEKIEESEIKGIEVPKGVSLENGYDQISGDVELQSESDKVVVADLGNVEQKLVVADEVDFEEREEKELRLKSDFATGQEGPTTEIGAAEVEVVSDETQSVNHVSDFSVLNAPESVEMSATNQEIRLDEEEGKHSLDESGIGSLEPSSVSHQEIRVEAEDDDGDDEDKDDEGENDGMIFGSSAAAKQFLEELERESGTGSHSGAESYGERSLSYRDDSQRVDGQIVTDSDEEVDTDEEGRQGSREFSLEAAKTTALELEADGNDDFDFSLNILVLGKTGVGKSATINSIFGEEKTPINAFGPSTTTVREIVGVVDGIKLRVFDTPGLKSAAMEQNVNRKILSSVQKFTKKCPPDIVLYVDRLDTQSRDSNDVPILRSITSAFGSTIWRSTIVTLTHAASAPPDGPSGSPLNYELFVAQRSQILQHTIGQAIGDIRFTNPNNMSPISLVENHPSCRKNREGEKVLPNGQSWRPQLLLLSSSMKVLAEATNLSKPAELFDHRKLYGFRTRSAPLPYFLSWLLQSRTHPKLSGDQGGENADSDIDLADLSDSDNEEEEDEYDQLPSFKPLKKAQIAKLSKEQKKAYLEEYDYRVKLLQKKMWREELKRMKEMKKGNKASADEYGYLGEEDPENGAPAAVPVALPDMVLPPSFDSENPAYRYRFLEPTSQFLARPVLDAQGWDHDCGYDGVNLEFSQAIVNTFPATVAVQVTKDKKDFTLHLDSSVAAKHGENGSSMAGFDIQNIGKQLAYIVRGETKWKNMKKNKTTAGVSMTFLGENVTTGLKLEDQIAIGKRLVLVGSAGTVRSQGDSAYGANLEVRLREADFPIGQDQSSVSLNMVKWRGDLALGVNVLSQFSLGRDYKIAVRAGLNNKRSGQISIRTSSSEQLQIVLVALVPIVRSIYNLIFPGASLSENYSLY